MHFSAMMACLLLAVSVYAVPLVEGTSQFMVAVTEHAHHHLVVRGAGAIEASLIQPTVELLESTSGM